MSVRPIPDAQAPNPPARKEAPPVCPACHRPMDLIRHCECGDVFVITIQDQLYFYERQLRLPRYCHRCRRARKQQRP